MTPCPNCHSTEYTVERGAGSSKPFSFLRRLFGGRQPEPAPAGPELRRCNFCATLFTPDEEETFDDDERRLEERRARMEERMSGFRDSAITSSMFPDAAADSQPPSAAGASPVGKMPPQPYRQRSPDEIAKTASASLERSAPGAGKSPPKPYRSPTLKELATVSAGIEMATAQGIKCLKCGYFANIVRKPDSTCPGCGRIYTKMEEEAEAERLEAKRKAEAEGR